MRPDGAQVGKTAGRLSRWLRTGWGLLAFAGFGYVPSGVLLAILSWKPTPGPYAVGQLYPYGGYANAWQVTAGFAFAAFGLLFVGVVIGAARLRSRTLWWLALGGFALMWFPHAFMGIAFFYYDPSLSGLEWWEGTLPPILAWMLLAGIGFLLSWRDLGTPSERGG
jgi:hypothetical protein